jgi:exfoliative toxin A/B
MSLVRRVPVAMSALALGLAALGNLLLPYSQELRAVCGLMAAAIVLLLVARVALDISSVRTELRNPAALAVLPAFFMAVMVLATYGKPYAPGPARYVWLVALALQLLVVAVFVTRFVVPFDLAKIMPAWFLVFVGFVVASVTSPAFGMQAIGRPLLYLGMFGYAAVLPAVAYRAIKGPALPEPALPTVAIFAAPPSLLLVGYLAVADAKVAVVVYALLALAAVSLLYVLASLPKLLRLRFCPACAALTFPFVISAIALKQSAAFLSTTGSGSFIPGLAVTLMDVFAAAMVVYAMVRYAAFLMAPQQQVEPSAQSVAL